MAARKRGLSLEEKRAKMLEIFYERKEFFQLKELEKLGPREKGVIAQSVKEVVQSLVDDGLVDNEKIGSLSCFWAFPSKALLIRQRRIAALSDEATDIDEKIQGLKESLQLAAAGKDDSEERRSALSSVAALEAELGGASAELASLEASSPAALAALDEEAKSAIKAANRWTDNVLAVKGWCSKKLGVGGAAIDKMFGIPEDFDNIPE